jgi:uncharacterized protein YndB with AHSA1/START domain
MGPKCHGGVFVAALMILTATAATAAPIDSALFDGRGPAPRSFVQEIEIAAPAADAYALWTDAEAWQRLMGPDSRAHIDLEIGGRYEWLFDGQVGSNGCQVLAYIPDRLVSFTWNAPPSQPTRERRTWVVVETETLGDRATRVRLTHLGFGEGDDWDATLAYFESAWGYVLPLMKKHLEGGSK